MLKLIQDYLRDCCVQIREPLLKQRLNFLDQPDLLKRVLLGVLLSLVKSEHVDVSREVADILVEGGLVSEDVLLESFVHEMNVTVEDELGLHNSRIEVGPKFGCLDDSLLFKVDYLGELFIGFRNVEF